MQSKDDIKKNIHICMPELTFVGMLIIAMSFKKSKALFQYDILPRYLRGVVRFLKVSPKTIEAVLSWVAGIPVEQIKYDDVVGYSDFHIGTQEKVSVIAAELLPLIETDCCFSLLEKILGKEPALSYAVKQIADEKIFKQLVASISCCVSNRDNARCIVAWNWGWPEEWLHIIKRNALYSEFDFFKWPGWYKKAAAVFFAFSLIPEIIKTVFWVFKRGVCLEKKDKKHYKIITEFIDPRRFNNTCYDADFWVDGKIIHKKDILFILTHEQKTALASIGYLISDITKDIKRKGYEIQETDTLPYPLLILKEYAIHILNIIKKAFTINSVILAQVLLRGLKEYLCFYPFFYHYSADNFIYLTIPNGHSGLRFNSGIITSLCRKSGIRSIGIQTRVVYSKNYEYAFDCFDLYFAWGKVWFEMLGSGSRFIRDHIVTGCTYLDYLSSASEAYKKKQTAAAPTRRLQVCIFPSDISPRHHYSLNYVISFMVNCARLAIYNPDIEFVVKNKEPQYTATIRNSESFMKIYGQIKDNFRFEDSPRYDYIELLCSSDIIIAIGFTTPGFEAMLLNKRVIYYSELKYGGQAYSDLPDFIAGNYEELVAVFKKAIVDYSIYIDKNVSFLNDLDPFRDGRARERINQILVGNA